MAALGTTMARAGSREQGAVAARREARKKHIARWFWNSPGKCHAFKPKPIKQRFGEFWELLVNRLGTNGNAWDNLESAWQNIDNFPDREHLAARKARQGIDKNIADKDA